MAVEKCPDCGAFERQRTQDDGHQTKIHFGCGSWKYDLWSVGQQSEVCHLRSKVKRLEARLRALEGDGTPAVIDDANLFTSDSGGGP